MDKKMKVTGGAALCLLFLASCSVEGGCISVTATQPVLLRPNPVEYPSQKPRPNPIIGRLPRGEYHFEESVDGKDFRAYRIRLPSGSSGYVIHTSETLGCANPERVGGRE